MLNNPIEMKVNKKENKPDEKRNVVKPSNKSRNELEICVLDEELKQVVQVIIPTHNSRLYEKFE